MATLTGITSKQRKAEVIKFTPKRKFGVELEIIVPDRLYELSYLDETAALLHAGGIKARSSNYSHKASLSWKVTTDGSLSRGGIELVSPILEGEEGLAEVAKVCAILTSNGYRVDGSCGLHVHIDARDFDTKGLFRVVRQFLAEETNFDRMVDPQRQYNTYCHSNLSYIPTYSDGLERLKLAHTKIGYSASHVARVFGNGRYLKLNIQALWRHHTIEFRQHEGSIDAAKVTSWIRLVGLFTDAAILCKNERYDDMVKNVSPSTSTREQMIEHFANMANRKGRRRKMKGGVLGSRATTTRVYASPSPAGVY